MSEKKYYLFNIRYGMNLDIDNQTLIKNNYTSFFLAIGILLFLFTGRVTQLLWPRSAGIISRLKNTVGWFFMREKYCSDWKNKLNKTDYKPDEQGHMLSTCDRIKFVNLCYFYCDSNWLPLCTKSCLFCGSYVVL
jgi:hypothetical protein